MAFAAASSRLVAAAELLGFFGRLPNKVGTALRFFLPPRAPSAAEEPEPRAASSLGVVFQSRRPQIGVVDVALRTIRDKLAGLSRGAGCRLHEGVLVQKKPTRIRNRIRP